MKFAHCDITAQQRKAWDSTRTALIWHCPAFSHILYTMMQTGNKSEIAFFTKDVPIAATDGSSLILNPDTFFKYDLPERVFIVSHEIMHCILNHCATFAHLQQRGKISYPDGKNLPYDAQTMNIAADLVINDILIESKVGKFNPDWLHDTKRGTQKDSAIDVYRRIYKDDQNKGKGGGGAGSGPPTHGKGFDEHLKPGTPQGNPSPKARNEAEWQTAIAGAMSAARAQGKLPGALDRMFADILSPQVDWRDKIEALFARKVGSGTFDWRRPDRRLITRDIYAPGRSSFGAELVIVAVDTSGSIGPKELDLFFAEMQGILEDVNPRRLLVAWCDSKLHRIDEAEDPGDLENIRHKGAPGGGGTSFIPVFNWITEEGLMPDALVYLTDGEGSFPAHSPTYNVIWGSILPTSKYPFGDVVDVPKQAA